MDPYEAFVHHVNPGLGNFLKVSGRDVKLVKAKGGTIEDGQGNRYDDWVTGCGSFNLGHNPEALKETIREHLARDVPNLYEDKINPHAGELAERLIREAGETFETCFFSNSGTEAVEAAIKTALVATGRAKIAYADGAYHGMTMGSLACMGRGLFRQDFEGVVAPYPEVPFGDLGALERVLSGRDVAAFIVEPIQVEAGVRIAPREYLEGAHSLCRKFGALLIFDEVQTGMGRTGTLFAFQQTRIAPDILVLAKSLGGGLVPVGATVMGVGIWETAFGGCLRCEIHNSTFGGNALACRVALRCLEWISEPSFLAAVRERGEELFSALEERLAGVSVVEGVPWRGLLGGIRLRAVDHPWLQWENLGLGELAGLQSAAPLLVERLERKGILTMICGHDWTVLRVEPPLTVNSEACAKFVDAVGDAVRWLDENAGGR